MTCPCGTSKEYSDCCEPYIKGKKLAPTAEALMRSRYSAHVAKDVKYLRESLAPESRHDYDEASAKKWMSSAEFKGLEIQSVKNGGEGDKKGTVEFTATYAMDGKTFEHHEVSQFRKDPQNHSWYFVKGDAHTHEEGHGHHHGPGGAGPQEPIKRAEPKVGRNDPCPCGSGKKYKKCCEAA